jgi:predicted phage replisome organizer
MFDDEKIRLIESMPDRDTILVIWIKLLAQAGKCNASGYLLLAQNIPYTDEMLSTIFNRPLNTVRMALETFKTFGMIDCDNSSIVIANWEKHQNTYGMELIREQSKRRVQKHREKLKELKQCNVTCNATVTHCNALDIDKELDIDKDINKDNTLSTDSSIDRVPYQKIVDLYNSICNTLPTVKDLTNKRKDVLRVCYREKKSIQYFEELFNKVNSSDFLTGRDGKWHKCCFDWIIKPSNRQKILEGNYDNREKLFNKLSSNPFD